MAGGQSGLRYGPKGQTEAGWLGKDFIMNAWVVVVGERFWELLLRE